MDQNRSHLNECKPDGGKQPKINIHITNINNANAKKQNRIYFLKSETIHFKIKGLSDWAITNHFLKNNDDTDI